MCKIRVWSIGPDGAVAFHGSVRSPNENKARRELIVAASRKERGESPGKEAND